MTMKADMTVNEISKKACQIISEVLNLPIESVHEGASLTGDLAADSLDSVEVVMTLEEEFQVTMEDLDPSSVQTVRDLIQHIANAIQAEAVLD